MRTVVTWITQADNWYSESKTVLTLTFIFSIYLESSTYCNVICSRKFTLLYNYFDHASVHVVKSAPCVIFFQTRAAGSNAISFIYSDAGSTNSRKDRLLNVLDIARGTKGHTPDNMITNTFLDISNTTRRATHIKPFDYKNLSRILIHHKLFIRRNKTISLNECTTYKAFIHMHFFSLVHEHILRETRQGCSKILVSFSKSLMEAQSSA